MEVRAHQNWISCSQASENLLFHRARRRLFHEHMKLSTVRQYYDTIERETVTSVLRIHDNIDDFVNEINLYVTKNILDITYGIQDLKSLKEDV